MCVFQSLSSLFVGRASNLPCFGLLLFIYGLFNLILGLVNIFRLYFSVELNDNKIQNSGREINGSRNI